MWLVLVSVSVLYMYILYMRVCEYIFEISKLGSKRWTSCKETIPVLIKNFGDLV